MNYPVAEASAFATGINSREDKVMKFFTRFENLLAQRRGQTMTEYALVIAGVAILVLFSGYQQIGQIIVAFVNQVVALF